MVIEKCTTPKGKRAALKTLFTIIFSLVCIFLVHSEKVYSGLNGYELIEYDGAELLTPLAPTSSGGNAFWESFNPGLDGICYAIAFDDNGDIYFGGTFTNAGGVAANRIVKYDGATWSALGDGLSGICLSLALDGNGNLYAGGAFSTAGGNPASRIAKWDGNSWSALGSGLNSSCQSIAFDSNGNLFASGAFTMAGDTTANRVAKWDGNSWSPLGNGLNSSCKKIIIDDAQHVYAAGGFTTAGDTLANRIARWDGTIWHPLGSGLEGGFCKDITFDLNGDIIAVGLFTIAGGSGALRIAKWDGVDWDELGNGLYGNVESVAIDDFGNIYAGGDFLQTGGLVNASKIAKFNGTNWSPMGSGVNFTCFEIVVDSANNVYAGGSFTLVDGQATERIAKWGLCPSIVSTFDTIVCDYYVKSNGIDTLFLTGLYPDSLIAGNGCDSVVMIDITVLQSTSNTIDTSICYSFTTLSGNAVYTTSGTYPDTIPNAMGCDSILTINLTILSSNSSTINPTVCDQYISPSENDTFNTSGTYMDTLVNAAGCDSLITINLTVLNSSSSTLNISTCFSYTNPSTTQIYLLSGTYQDTIPNALGCDSIITIHLTILNDPGSCPYVMIPDTNFEQKLIDLLIDTQDTLDGQILTSDAAAVMGTLDISNSGICDLSGIEAFTNITGLNCWNNDLTELHVNNLTGLTYLFFRGNDISEFDLSNLTNLVTFNCKQNNISSLDLTGLVNLETIDCSVNNLNELDIQNLPSLRMLTCSNNNLTTLNASNLASLNRVWCEYNDISSFDFSNSINIDDIRCRNNQLTDLDVTLLSSLISLRCEYNQLSYLDASGKPNLTELYCHNNQLDSVKLDGLSSVTSLHCYTNNLTELNVTDLTALKFLYCSDNDFTSLKLENLPVLDEVNCGYNDIESMTLTNLPLMKDLLCSFNQIWELDLSDLPSLERFSCSNNNLYSLNIMNGNNTNFNLFYVINNPNLTCITVDDPVWADANWTFIDPIASFSDSCFSTCNSILDNTMAGALNEILGCVAPGDTISFDSCVFGDTLVLTSSMLVNLPVFNLIADPSWNITIDASALTNALEITEGSNATIEGVKIISGTALLGSGINNSGNLTLIDVSIITNPNTMHTQIVNNTGTIVIQGNTMID